MKKTTLMTLVCVLFFSTQAMASNSSNQWSGQRFGLIGACGIFGTLLGGPVGTVIGVAIGDWFNNKAKPLHKNSWKESDKDEEEHDDYQVSHNRHVQPHFNTIFFSTASDQITETEKQKIDYFASILKNNRTVNLEIKASTDPRGKNGYDNQALSDRRANSIKNYLVSRHELSSSRIFTTGIGAVQNTNKPFKELRVATLTLSETTESTE